MSLLLVIRRAVSEQWGVTRLRNLAIGFQKFSNTAKTESENANSDRMTVSNEAETEECSSWFESTVKTLTRTREEGATTSVEESEKKFRKPSPPTVKYMPETFLKSYTFSPFMEENETLQNLVDLGVNLSQLEGRYNASDIFLKLDWTRDVEPLCKFLVDYGVPLTSLGEYLTKNPWIFQQSMENLNARVNYLQSKNFSTEAIGKIIVGARYWLNLEVKTVDGRLGWLQKEFCLTGDQVRAVITKVPKLVALGTGHIQLLKFKFFEEMGFSNEEMKELLLKDPKLWITADKMLLKSFDYLHRIIGFSHRRILEFPWAMRFPVWKIRQRHEFLNKLGRDQYDPEKPSYVSIGALVSGLDVSFCQRAAKCSVNVYNQFLKSD